VVVKEIKEKSVPELSDEFAKDLGAAGVEELRTRIQEDLVTRAGRAAEKKAREAVLDEVVRAHAFDVPGSMVDDELTSQLRRMAMTLAQQGIDVTKTPIDWNGIRDQERPNAEKAVRNSIVLAAVAKKESLEISETELDEQLTKIAEGTSKPAAVLRAELEKEGRIDYIRDQMLQDKALDFIYRNANISRG
jgi:trigger factor